ncbi:MAG: bifunctional enoyl-CoA hydratase/phosphate acetyltransferase [Candidatus Zixiibacteriota bacterium]|nr:MAG: bifunctional enoyl-CoA hydratase/phosphate acetyltransferase [candidate division Zixibacteria bacterium]
MAHEDLFPIPKVRSFEQVHRKAISVVSEKGKRRIAVIAPSANDSLEGIAKATEMGLIDPHLIGDRSTTRKCAHLAGLDSSETEFIDVAGAEEAIRVAVKMAVDGQVDILVKGQVTAINLLKHMLDRSESFVCSSRTLSHVAVMKPERYGKLLFLSDAAVNAQPDFKTKLALISNAVGLANVIGVDQPGVAVLAAAEIIDPRMPVTIDAAIIAKMSDRGQIEGTRVDGPLSFDVAVDMAAAHAKGITDSHVAGQADIVLAPNIETANGVYRAMNLYGRAEMGGIVVGGAVPVVISSRSDSVQTRFNSLIVGIMATLAQ